jgi:hypothetical protein
MKPLFTAPSFVVLSLSALLLPSMAVAQGIAPSPVSPHQAASSPAAVAKPATLPVPPDIGGGSVKPPGAPADETAPKTYASYETTPLEVALLYYKLLHIDPPYDSFIYNNEGLLKKTDGFGQGTVLNQQRDIMHKIYDGFNDTSIITSSSKVTIVSSPMDTEIVTMTGIAPDLPLIYKLSNNDRYGIFIRNAKETGIVSPPYALEDFNKLVSSYNGLKNIAPVELLLKPVVADAKPFRLNTGDDVKVVVADIVEMRILDRKHQQVLLKKRFKNWKPQEELKTEADSLVSPDLLPKLRDDGTTKDSDK